MKVSPRIYSLLEVLSRSGLDWLAQEVLNGIVNGKVPLEEPKVLRDATEAASRPFQDSGRGDQREWMEPEPKPMEELEQLDWAANHVLSRLRETTKMMRVSIMALDQIVDDDSPTKSARGAIMLIADEFEAEVNANALKGAEAGLGQLEEALAVWRNGIDGGSPA